jgi:hypothetical protein
MTIPTPKMQTPNPSQLKNEINVPFSPPNAIMSGLSKSHKINPAAINNKPKSARERLLRGLIRHVPSWVTIIIPLFLFQFCLVRAYL